MRLYGVAIVFWLATAGPVSAAEVRFAGIFTDHAVLQRDRPVPIWGWADPAAEVTVSFAGQEQAATADASGRWQVQLEPLAASAEPRRLSVSSAGATVSLDDLLVGDVWLACGQSNMGFSIPKSTHAQEARQVIPHPQLRRFKVGPWLSHQPLADLGAEGAIQDPRWRMGDDGQWRAVANERFGLDWISAVAAWFVHEVRLSQDIPIGLIESHFGGSKLHCWMPLESLEQSPEFSRDVLEQYRKQKAAWDQHYASWKADPSRDSKQPPTEPWRPACLYNAMIHPLAPLAVRGVIWYQGESNVGRAEAYRRQLPAMVKAWRTAFQHEDLWFLAVQLPAFGKVRQWPRSAWAEIRESIAESTAALPSAASIVSTDCGLPDEIHPPLKKPIGQRLARAARALVYGDDTLVWSGPTLRQAEFADGRCTVRFNHVGDGLVARDGPLVGFALAGRDQVFHPAAGEIVDEAVVLTSADVPDPVAVRYAWQDSPVANLWNRDGLPAGSFRSDNWQLLTQARITTPLT
ncbi:MAG: sialate O-acetylesterase, partial [Pirellulales bacterium]